MGHYLLNVNGAQHSVDAPGNESLLFVLRNHLHLTGAKYGCGEGQCGACTVLINGRATRSCLVAVSTADGLKIETIEGLEQDGKLNAVQQAFEEEGAMQCGYCTPGMIVNATSLLRRTQHPTDEQIVAAMNGNVCRCGTYPRILAAIRRAAQSGEAV